MDFNNTGSSPHIETLSLVMCNIVDLPSEGIQCSEKYPNICVKCPFTSVFIFGGDMDNSFSAGCIVNRLIWISTVLICIFGTLSDLLIITILKRRNSDNPFDFLLVALAHFDIFCCIISTLSATGSTAYFDNWSGRGQWTLLFGLYAWLTMLVGRSMSTFATIVITIERYLVIAFPMQSKTWFTRGKAKLWMLTVLVLSILLGIPRFSSYVVDYNPYSEIGYDIASLSRMDYIVKATRFNSFWYGTLDGFHNRIDIALPLPILLIFNLLTFWEVRKFNKNRKRMNLKQRKEIQAVKTFLPVTIFLFFDYIGFIVHYSIVKYSGMIYREMNMLVTLAIALNSSINFAIYYFRGETFKAEAQALLTQWFGWKWRGPTDIANYSLSQTADVASSEL